MLKYFMVGDTML